MRNLIILLALLIHCSNAFAEFDNGRAGFSVTVNNEIYSHRVFAIYVLPKERLILRTDQYEDMQFELKAASGAVEKTTEHRWTWTAPDKPGLTSIVISRKADGETIKLNTFVMVPSSKLNNRRLNGVLIGQYPPPIGDDPLYARPDGFIEVTEENLSTPVSPHFVLGQFVSQTNKRFPKYIVLRERLILKLEAMLERFNERGIETESLAIVAGYLSPAYNAATGRDRYSRHIYGGAALFIVDRQPADGIMDDLNGNGVIDDADAQVLYKITDELFTEEGKSYLRGGLFVYSTQYKGGPYLMVDARGYRKRWKGDNDLFPALDKVQNKMDELRAKHRREFK